MYVIIAVAGLVVAFLGGIVLGYSMAVSYMTLEIEELDFCEHDYDRGYCPEGCH